MPEPFTPLPAGYFFKPPCEPEVSGLPHLRIGQEVRKVIGQADRVASAADLEVASTACRGDVLHFLAHAQELRTHEFDL